MGKGLYEILDLEEDATPNSIKGAYLRLKHQFEQNLPEYDKNHISTIQYQAISEAFAVLSTPKRRDLYDQKLITERQRSYTLDEGTTSFPLIKVIGLVLLVVAACGGYMKYQAIQAEKRALQRIELEMEQARLKQEELRLEIENAQLEREQIYAAQQQEWRDTDVRERNLERDRREARKLAYDTAQAEAAEKRRLETAQREQTRHESAWQRRERASSVSSGPTVVRQ